MSVDEKSKNTEMIVSSSRDTLLPYGRQTITNEDISAVVKTLQSDFLTTGPKVKEFEEAFAKKTNAKYAVAVSNGTAALHAAMAAAGIDKGSEVITTPLTFSATANAVLYMGAKPVFSDILDDTLNIDPGKVEEKITTKTKAIIAVDFAGQPANISRLQSICRKHDLLLIEDAAHSLGALYKDKLVGSLSDMTTFSFHPVKHITTAEGGMVTTDSLELYSKLSAFRNHGITVDYRQRQDSGSWLYDIASIGFNYRLSDIQSALGISQLSRLDEMVTRRREIAASYNNAFRNNPLLDIPFVEENTLSSWHLYVIKLRLGELCVGRTEIFKALRAHNIGVNVHYIPVPWMTLYQDLGYTKGQWPVTESVYEQIISLPIWPGMSNQDVKDVINVVANVLEHFKK